MVNNKIKITILGIFLTIVFSLAVTAQEDITYNVLAKYRKWGYMAGPAIYNRAQNIPNYGSYTFINKPIPGFNAGITYDFHPERKWSIVTGLWVAKEPIYSIHYNIKNEDLYPAYQGDLIDDYKSYSIVSFSSPLFVRFNLQARQNAFLHFLTGFKAMYFPYGDSYFGLLISDETISEIREIFGLKLKSQVFPLYGSFVVGTGGSIALQKILVKMNLIYIMNYPNTIEGEYQFGNLFSSPPTRGDYKFSGNYMALQFSVNFFNPRHKWLKINLHLNDKHEKV